MKQTSLESIKHSIFWLFFKAQYKNLKKLAQCFNPCPSLPPVATDNRKQFQCLIIVLNNKTGPFFLEFNWCEDKYF